MRGPSIGRETAATERFTFQLSVEHSRQLRSRAAIRRIGVATLIREIIIKALETETPPDQSQTDQQ